MHSVHAEMWDPQLPSKHASPLSPRPPSHTRPAHVTTATPAKRITFYKSGDSQFGGVKMAIHKRSFKCFDALLDDLSQKVPLPFGVRTVTTPRGTHAIKHLEQLQDGGCYLCSDRRQAKPVNMELASKRPGIWYHHSRRPQRPSSSSGTPPGHFSYRQRRILLVKNSEPGIRRSVALSRRSTRSLGAFLDDVSEVMQFHVRKLYTAEGRRIDSVQSLMTCPGVLVCVGREAFSPMLVNSIRKSSEEKLPGVSSRSPGLGPRTPGNGARSPSHGAQSRASEYSEVHECKKNVNFGLETKKSIIHPRSDSSNRSTRFSLSSEKSYGNGVNTYSQGRPSIMNDDIEKRVLVNKDGSLSVEMRVRFRLHNDETLHWSTQVKKSPPLTNECQAPPHYLQQGQSESCSDPDSSSFDPEGVDYSNQPHVLEGNRCPCCYQRQEQQYDLWENPAHCHKHPPVPPPPTSRHIVTRHTHSSSSSSSCNSRRVVRCRARVGGGSEPSQIVQEEMFVTEQVEVEQDGDTRVEVCRVSRGCSRSEVVAIDSNVRPISRNSVEEEVMMGEERPLSAISSSSHVLQSLKEDQDDDLPPSASQCCHSIKTSPTSQTHKEDEEERASRAASACDCGAATPHSTAEDRALSSQSKTSRASRRSCKAKIPISEEEEAADEEIKRVVSSLSGLSQKSKVSNMCSNCGGCKRGVNSESKSRASQRSDHSHQASPNPPTPLSSHENANNGSDDEGSVGSAGSTQSNRTNLTKHGRCSAISHILESRESIDMSNPDGGEAEEERAQSNMSAKSHKSNCSCTSEAPDIKTREDNVERANSSLSTKSGASAKSSASVKIAKAASPTDNTAVEEEDTDKRAPSALSVEPSKAERPDSVLSAKSAKSAKSTKSNVSAKSGRSHRSGCSHCVKAESAAAKEADEPEETKEEEGTETEERAVSAMSAKSNLSAKSNKSTKAPERSLSPRSATGEAEEGRAASQVSNVSVKSSKSCKESPGSEEKDNENVDDEQQRPVSVISAKSASSAKSHHTSSRVASPAMADRTPSAMSGKSHTSAKSSKSQKSNRTAASPNPNEADIPSIETNGEEEKNENQERVASSMSVKSKSSARSHTSNKSSKTLKPVSPSPNVVDEDRAKSAASAKSGKSNVSTSSRKSSPNKTAAVNADPQSQLLHDPGVGESRGPSALSVHSTKSAKSGKCGCGSASALEKATKDQEGEEHKESEEASERAASALSTKSQRRESGGTEQPLSRNSSVSLGLPEDQDTDSDSGKSSVCHINTERKGRWNTATPRETGSIMSQNSSRKRTHNCPAVPTINTPGGSEVKGEEDEKQATERGDSALSAKSSKSSCSCGIKVNPKEQRASATPTKEGNDLKIDDNRTSSVMSSASAKGRSKSRASTSTKKDSGDAESKAMSRPASEAKEKEDIADNMAASVHSKSPCRLRPESAGSAHSGSKSKASKENKGEDSVKNHKAKSSSSTKTSKSQKKVKSSSPCPSQSSRRSESTLSHSLSAADLLKETMAAARPHSKRSERCQRNQEELEELSPACLPNASPNEVVSDWLRSLPNSMLGLADEPNEEEGEQVVDEKPEEPEENPEDDKGADEEEKVEAEEKEEEAGGDAAESSDPAAGEAVEAKVLSGDSLPRSWQSSAAVMKVLLSSSMGRCNSLPEVSPVYGRRLSTSARGLLDCLAQLQLIDPAVSPGLDPQKNQRYEDVMVILQSLWLTEQNTDIVKEQVTPPRSSSGLGMSSGSGGSGKENGNQGGDETNQNETKETSLHEDEGAVKVVEEEDEGAEKVVEEEDEGAEKVVEEEDEGAEKVVEEEEEANAEAEPEEADGAEEADGTEEADGAEEAVQSEEQSTVPPSLDSPKNTENPSSSSPNDSSKSPTDNEQDTLEDSSSGTPPTVVRAPLSKKLSQDPDPVWVLHLLKKLEKQFMNHYINAMAEFKVRWDLDDSLILNTMIGELREEVSKRIQNSIQHEVKKIQGRAGRGGRLPRPPQRGTLSRESTMTERRRRILKVMKNQPKTEDSQSDGEMTGEFSDQRSEDEYCPCDACVRKKMAARPLRENPMATEAPVMMEFDLLKILQLKKSSAPVLAVVPQPAEGEGESEVAAEEVRNLEVVQEEEEEDETKEDIQAKIVLEETIPEEDEEIEEEEEEGNEESSAGDKEQEEGEAGGEETGEEEEETECQCQCATNEEESDKAGEGEEETAEGEDKTGEEEERAEEENEETAEGDDAEETTGEDKTGEEEEEVEEAECQCQCAGNEEEIDKAEEEEEERAGEDETGEIEETEEVKAEGEETSDNTGEEEEKAGEEEGENAEEEEETGGNEGEIEGGEEEEESDKEMVKEAAAEEGETTESGEGEEGEVSENKVEEEETTGGEEEAGETEEDNAAKNEEDEDKGDDAGEEGESHEEEKEEESGEQGGEASEEERAASQCQEVTEGEEADAEDLDADGKPPSDTGAEEKDDGGDEDAVEEVKPEEEDEEEEEVKKRDGALIHQFTKTSVESQPGSLEDIDTDSPLNPVASIEVPKMANGVCAGGGTGQRRSRSPGRVKCRKPKECELDDF